MWPYDPRATQRKEKQRLSISSSEDEARQLPAMLAASLNDRFNLFAHASAVCPSGTVVPDIVSALRRPIDPSLSILGLGHSSCNANDVLAKILLLAAERKRAQQLHEMASSIYAAGRNATITHPNLLDPTTFPVSIDQNPYSLSAQLLASLQHRRTIQLPPFSPSEVLQNQEPFRPLLLPDDISDDAAHSPPSTPIDNDSKPRALQSLSPSRSTDVKESPKRKQQHIKSPKPGDEKTTDRRWMERFGELKSYKNEHGDCMVPRGYSPNPSLASWVNEQRKQYKIKQEGQPSHLNEKRLQFLNEVDFEWNAQEALWDRRFRELSEFYAQHGHCNVPREDRALRSWILEQRRQYRLNSEGKPCPLTPKRIEQLNSIGFCWNSYEATWQGHYDKLVVFHKEHGSCCVPNKYDPKLATWVREQRHQHKHDSLSEDRVRLLDQLNFEWDMAKRK